METFQLDRTRPRGAEPPRQTLVAAVSEAEPYLQGYALLTFDDGGCCGGSLPPRPSDLKGGGGVETPSPSSERKRLGPGSVELAPP
jgi:hypothetical protein